MSAPSAGSSSVEALLDTIFSCASRDDDYWDAISALEKEPAFVRPFVIARLERRLQRAEALEILRVFDVLMHLQERTIARLAVPFASHKDPDVRTTVARALEESRDVHAIAALVTLCGDDCDAVRSAAVVAIVHGLGVPGERDFVSTPAICDALASCLDDVSETVRDEAILGLARRKDSRALSPLAVLIANDDLVAPRVDAAYHFAAPELRPLLARHADAGCTASGDWTLVEALAACTVDLR